MPFARTWNRYQFRAIFVLGAQGSGSGPIDAIVA
jgi:hypothetical protein